MRDKSKPRPSRKGDPAPKAPRAPMINCGFCRARVRQGSKAHFVTDTFGAGWCRKRPEYRKSTRSAGERRAR